MDLKGHLIGGWNKSMYAVLDFFFFSLIIRKLTNTISLGGLERTVLTIDIRY